MREETVSMDNQESVITVRGKDFPLTTLSHSTDGNEALIKIVQGLVLSLYALEDSRVDEVLGSSRKGRRMHPEAEKIVGLWADAVVRELDIAFIAATGNRDPEVCARLRYEVTLRLAAHWIRRENLDPGDWLKKLCLTLGEIKRQAEYDKWVEAGCPGPEKSGFLGIAPKPYAGSSRLDDLVPSKGSGWTPHDPQREAGCPEPRP